MSNTTVHVPQNGGVTVLAVFYLFLSLYTIITNLLELVIIARIKTSSSTIFIASLALTDLSMGISAILPSSISYLANDWVFGNFVCDVFGLIYNTSMFASLLTVLCITANRYVALVFPLYYRKLSTNKAAYLLTSALWFVCLVRSLMPYFFGERYTYMKPAGYCSYGTQIFGAEEVYYYAALIILPFLLCFVVLIFCPLHMIVILYRRQLQRSCAVGAKGRKSGKFYSLKESLTTSKSSQDQEQSRITRKSGKNGRSKQNEWDATVTTLLVITLFIICYSIYYFFAFYYFSYLLINHEVPAGADKSWPFEISDSVYAILEVLYGLALNLNSVFNPIIYLFRNTTFRHELVDIKLSLEKRLRCSSDTVPHQVMRAGKTSSSSVS